MISRRLFAGLIGAAIVGSTVCAQGFVKSLSGTYKTSKSRGALQFTGLKAVNRIGVQGDLKINAKTFPAMVYGLRGTVGLGVVWYDPIDYHQVGAAQLSPTSKPNQFSGKFQIFNTQGQVVDSGTIQLIQK